MTKDEILNRIRAFFVVRYNTLLFKNSNGELKYFSIDNLIYLCGKVYNLGYEEGMNKSLEMDSFEKSYNNIKNSKK